MRYPPSSRFSLALTALFLTAAPLRAQVDAAPPQPLPLEAPSFAQAPAAGTDTLPRLPATEAAPEGATLPQTAIPSTGPAATPTASPTTSPTAAPVTQDMLQASPLQAPAGTPQIASGMPHDLSPWGMYEAADIVVKAVMLGLLFATFVTLTILAYKVVELALAKRAVRKALKVLRKSQSLRQAADALAQGSDPAAFMTRAALDEYHRSFDALDVAGNDGVKERVRSIVERTEAQAGRKLALGTGILATIGSTAPFVGLFGTVWGIMNSFISIAKTQTTNLAIVAPGIAEALLATAIGLVAAIPAVIVYNHFARQIQGYRQMLADAGAAVERLLSRDLDFRKIDQA